MPPAPHTLVGPTPVSARPSTQKQTEWTTHVHQQQKQGPFVEAPTPHTLGGPGGRDGAAQHAGNDVGHRIDSRGQVGEEDANGGRAPFSLQGGHR